VWISHSGGRLRIWIWANCLPTKQAELKTRTRLLAAALGITE